MVLTRENFAFFGFLVFISSVITVSSDQPFSSAMMHLFASSSLLISCLSFGIDPRDISRELSIPVVLLFISSASRFIYIGTNDGSSPSVKCSSLCQKFPDIYPQLPISDIASPYLSDINGITFSGFCMVLAVLVAGLNVAINWIKNEMERLTGSEVPLTIRDLEYMSGNPRKAYKVEGIEAISIGRFTRYCRREAAELEELPRVGGSTATDSLNTIIRDFYRTIIDTRQRPSPSFITTEEIRNEYREYFANFYNEIENRNGSEDS